MDRLWRATVHAVAESDVKEGLSAHTPRIGTVQSCRWCVLFEDLPCQRLAHSSPPSPPPSSPRPASAHKAWHIRGS